MASFSISPILEVVVGLGLLNVWLVRAQASTAFRGGTAQSLREEFNVYGLPDWIFYLVGVLKIGSGVLLIGGHWVPEVVRPAAGTVAVLMVAALSMHAKVKDPLVKSLPAFLMLLMAVAIVLLQ
jgi:DoxX-like family